MAWLNEEVAGLLREYAELTEITGGDAFRARNYTKAARSVRGWGEDIGPLDVKALRTIPGVGASIAAKIAEYRDTGRIRARDELRAKVPPGVLELTRVPGLGPKRAIDTFDETKRHSRSSARNAAAPTCDTSVRI
jgi:DNA polymerase (family X)